MSPHSTALANACLPEDACSISSSASSSPAHARRNQYSPAKRYELKTATRRDCLRRNRLYRQSDTLRRLPARTACPARSCGRAGSRRCPARACLLPPSFPQALLLTPASAQESWCASTWPGTTRCVRSCAAVSHCTAATRLTAPSQGKLNWAICGRSKDKLDAVKADLVKMNPACEVCAGATTACAWSPARSLTHSLIAGSGGAGG